MNKDEAIQYYLSKQHKARSENSRTAYHSIVYYLQVSRNMEQVTTSLEACTRTPNPRRPIYRRALQELRV